MNKFQELGLNESLAKKIERQGITEPTAIQTKAIPEILKGHDVVGESSTGSGKTIAFGAGILNNDNNKGLFALVLTPTREIAHQVADVFRSYSNLKVLPIYGGVGIGPQIDKLRTANIVVATPGRLLDHIERRTIDLRNVRTLVLDEADKMFEMGFIDDVKRIMSLCPTDKQSLLFSATFSKEINEIIKHFMKNPIRIKGEERVDPAKLKQVYYNVPVNLKFSLLVKLLQSEESDLALVFCNTKRMVDTLYDSLKINGVKAKAIHGGLTQAKRKQSLDALKSHQVEILLCTDVAARGLDIPNVSHVYNYDLPNDATDYVHRTGRTARAGKDGLVINLLTRNDHGNFSKILREYPRLKIEELETPAVDKTEMVKASRGDRDFKPSRNNPRDTYSSRSGGRSQRSGGFGGRSSDRSERPRSSGFRGRDRESSSRPPRAEGSESSERSERPRSGGFGNRSSGGFGGRNSERSDRSDRPSRSRSSGFGGRSSDRSDKPRSSGFGSRSSGERTFSGPRGSSGFGGRSSDRSDKPRSSGFGSRSSGERTFSGPRGSSSGSSFSKPRRNFSRDRD